MKKYLLALLAAVSVILAFLAGWVGGAWLAVREVEKQRFVHESELVISAISNDPAYQQIAIFDFPMLGICLGGPVQNQTDYDRLQDKMSRTLGEPRVQHVMADVWIEKALLP